MTSSCCPYPPLPTYNPLHPPPPRAQECLTINVKSRGEGVNPLHMVFNTI
jgi:hypothetical protein